MASISNRIGRLNRAETLSLLDRARWAPSGDNCQPWRVRATLEGLELCYDGSLPAFLDYRSEASRIAMGAFAENIRLAASCQDLACEIEYFSDESDCWARAFFGGSTSPDLLANQIEHRSSNRQMFQTGSVQQADADSLRRICAGTNDLSLTLVTEREQMSEIAKAVAIADRVRLRHKTCHVEFHEKVRWSQQTAEDTRTGFAVRTFEIKPHEALALRMTKSYSTMRLFDAVLRMGDMAAAVAKRQVLRSGAIGLLFCHHRTAQSLMTLGSHLQRLWLQATERKLGFQVLAVAPIFIRRLAQGGDGFSTKQARQVQRLRKLLAAVTRHPIDELALMFRIGRGPEPSARTYRLESGKLLIS